MKLIKSMLVGLLVLNCVAVGAQESKQMQTTVVKSIQVEKERGQNVDESSPEQIAKQQTEEMTELLSLSEEQIANVYELNLMVANKIEVIKKSDMTPERKDEFIEGNRKDRMNALSTILTADQHAEYVAHMSK